MLDTGQIPNYRNSGKLPLDMLVVINGHHKVNPIGMTKQYERA
jgi:hypothetical protein